MKYHSVFEIIGPIMVGPSSSHTAGAVRIGRLARALFGRLPRTLDVQFFGSFAETYQGHGTDVAVVAGVLGLETGDPLIPESMRLAQEQGLAVRIVCASETPGHPNTARLILADADESMVLTGVSIGGGHARITEWNGFELNLTGEAPTILIQHLDIYGTITAVTDVIAEHRINIARMTVDRQEKGRQALMVIETDQLIGPEAVSAISRLPHILRVMQVQGPVAAS